MLKVGDVAPEFILPDENGDEVSLTQRLANNAVILYFYPRDDTPGCTKEACGFRDAMPAIVERNATVLGVSADPVDSHERFRDKYDLNFPLLADVDHAVAEAYRLQRFPGPPLALAALHAGIELVGLIWMRARQLIEAHFGA